KWEARDTSWRTRVAGYRLLSAHVLFVQPRVLTGERNFLPVDEQMLDLGADFQWIAVGHQQVRYLTLFHGTQLITRAPNLGRVDRERLERLIIGQSESNRRGCLIWNIPDELVGEGAEGELHTGFVCFGGQSKSLVIRIVLFIREGQDPSQNHRYIP